MFFFFVVWFFVFVLFMYAYVSAYVLGLLLECELSAKVLILIHIFFFLCQLVFFLAIGQKIFILVFPLLLDGSH